MDYQQQYSPRGFRVLPPVIKNLIIINGLFFAATYVFGSALGFDLTEKLGLHYFGSNLFKPYQLITYMFMHGGFAHIFFNMFALWMFGNVLEEIWGGQKFLFFYFVCGIGAALTQMLVNWIQFYNIQTAFAEYLSNASPETYASFIKHYFPEYYGQIYSRIILAWHQDPVNPIFIEQSKNFVQDLITMRMNIPTIGASGAVFGILLAFGMIFPNALLYIYFFFPIKAKYFVIIYALIELYSGFSNNQDNVAHFAHLGGLVFGFILIKLWQRNQFNRFN
jgi:membrane associated rhomboid family serine protease